ncbi:MAG: hypothetical protein VW378_02455 [bacterium]
MSQRPIQSCCSQQNARKAGSFKRKSDGRVVKRYWCKVCKKYFSQATFDPAYRQKKRHLNHSIKIALASLNSQRRLALMFNVNKNTIARKARYLAEQARLKMQNDLTRFSNVKEVQFDELQTYEHSKCKPLSVALAVSKTTRKILGFQVGIMPATGHLAKISVRKYGHRPDERRQKMNALFQDLKQHLAHEIHLKSDECRFYKHIVKRHFPHAIYQQFKGHKSCVAGQGELKKVKRDPIFIINHTFAMLRANINRLIRRTWGTTKKISHLIDHLHIYMWVHNQYLTA